MCTLSSPVIFCKPAFLYMLDINLPEARDCVFIIFTTAWKPVFQDVNEID